MPCGQKYYFMSINLKKNIIVREQKKKYNIKIQKHGKNYPKVGTSAPQSRGFEPHIGCLVLEFLEFFVFISSNSFTYYLNVFFQFL